MKKPMELADQLVREHADRIADVVTSVYAVSRCFQFTLRYGAYESEMVRLTDGAYRVLVVVEHRRGDDEVWSIPETNAQRNVTKRIEDYCRAHDAEIRLAIDAALTPGPKPMTDTEALMDMIHPGDGTNEDSLDCDFADDGVSPEMAAEFARRLAEAEDARFNADWKDGGA